MARLRVFPGKGDNWQVFVERTRAKEKLSRATKRCSKAKAREDLGVLLGEVKSGS